MPNRLEPINLIDFTGGLSLRKNQFAIAPNESPEMVNISIDPLGGVYTRRGWQRWSDDIIDPDLDEWDPRRAWLHQLADGTDIVTIASANKLYACHTGTAFAELAGVDAEASPHMADFATFGDDLYITVGRLNDIVRRSGVTLPVDSLAAAGTGTWNDDYLTPVHDVAPRAEVIESHSGYLFAANTSEDDVTFPNRVRWSHPTSPDDWAQLDFIDIDTGGSHITGLISYEDHLLIFKRDSIWALYGYDQDSWQLVQKSATIGAISPQGISRSETAVFFYSASDRGGVFVYGGERPQEISAQLRDAMETLTHPELVWVGWIGRKLWVTLPWTYDGPTDENAAVFVFDPSVGDSGAWTYYYSVVSALGPIVAGSNIDSQTRPMAVLRNIEVPCVVYLDAEQRAVDKVWEVAVAGMLDPLAAEPDEREGFIVTESDEEIIMSGMDGAEPFDTIYRTPWITAGWPTRKKSFRRPDFVCRITGQDHDLQVRSYRDYEELQPKRQHRLSVAGGVAGSTVPGGVAATWGHFDWGDGTLWGAGGTVPTTSVLKQGASIRRGSSFGLCRSLQLRVAGMTPKANWGIDAIVLKAVMRRFR